MKQSCITHTHTHTSMHTHTHTHLVHICHTNNTLQHGTVLYHTHLVHICHTSNTLYPCNMAQSWITNTWYTSVTQATPSIPATWQSLVSDTPGTHLSHKQHPLSQQHSTVSYQTHLVHICHTNNTLYPCNMAQYCITHMWYTSVTQTTPSIPATWHSLVSDTPDTHLSHKQHPLSLIHGTVLDHTHLVHICHTNNTLYPSNIAQYRIRHTWYTSVTQTTPSIPATWHSLVSDTPGTHMSHKQHPLSLQHGTVLYHTHLVHICHTSNTLYP